MRAEEAHQKEVAESEAAAEAQRLASEGLAHLMEQRATQAAYDKAVRWKQVAGAKQDRRKDAYEKALRWQAVVQERRAAAEAAQVAAEQAKLREDADAARLVAEAEVHNVNPNPDPDDDHDRS